MATVLSFNEQDRTLLLLLTPEQRDSVILSLLLGEKQEMDQRAEGVWQILNRANQKREKTRSRVANHRERYKERYSNAQCNGYSNGYPPLSPSSPPFLPPSPLPPEPPISSPPYNPPSPSSISPAPPRKARAKGRPDAEFDAFWSAYPRKDGKQSARKAFDKVPSSISVELLVSAIRRQECSDQWKHDSGRFIPLPSTWLNQARWEDEGLKREDSPEGRPQLNTQDMDRMLADLAEMEQAAAWRPNDTERSERQ